MILVACCPPGNVSNILTHRARGDVALSVSMTAVSNVLAIFLMPLNVAFWGVAPPDRHRGARGHRPERRGHAARDRARDRGAVRPRPHHPPAVAAVRVAGGHRSSARSRSSALVAIIVIGVSQQLGDLRRLHRRRAGRGVPARRAGAAARLLDRAARRRLPRPQHQGDDVRGRHPQRRARAAARLHLLRRARRDGAGRGLVGDLGHHRRARGRPVVGNAHPRAPRSPEVAA